MSALFVLAMIVTALVLDWAMQAARARRMPAAVAVPSISTESFEIDPGVFHSPGHTWTRIAPDGRVRIGIDEFTRKAVGPLDKVELPRAGMKVRKGETLITAVRDGRRITLASPLSGTIAATNASRGGCRAGEWLICLQPTRIGAELKRLLIGEEAAAWLAAEIARFREFLVDGFGKTPALAATLPDGGVPVDGVLNHLSDEIWGEFQEEFLDVEE